MTTIAIDWQSQRNDDT